MGQAVRRREDFFPYQRTALSFFMEHGRCAWWVDMGLGKTAPAMTAAADLLADFAVGKVLIVGPKRVVESTWPDEKDEWEHLQHLRISVCTGGKEGVLAGISRVADIYAVNVDMLDFLVEHYKKKWPFDFVILDESSQYKTPGSRRFRALRKLVRRGLITHLLELTGTPSPNGLLDVWSQMYLIDKGEALGSTYTDFKRTYFTRSFDGYSWDINPGAEERIYERLDDKVLVIKGANTEPPVMNQVKVKLSPEAQELYDELERDMLIELTAGETVEAVNRAVLKNKLQQLASGEVYLIDEKTEQRIVKHIHAEKLDALESIVNEASGKPLLVGYAFKHERDAILKRFPKAVDVGSDPDIIRKWNAGKIPMLIGHPASMGHGLNLQKGGHLAVWYGLNWSLELYQQFNKRLDRTGQKHRVIIHHLICEGTVDEDIYAAMARKDATQTALTNAVLRRAKLKLTETKTNE